MGLVIVADKVPEDVLLRVREHPCPIRHAPDGRWREPGEPCYKDPPADDVARYERAARKGRFALGEMESAMAVAEDMPSPPEVRPVPVPAIPPGSQGDSPLAIMAEYPGWGVKAPTAPGGRWAAWCPAVTVGGDTPGALRAAIEDALR